MNNSIFAKILTAFQNLGFLGCLIFAASLLISTAGIYIGFGLMALGTFATLVDKQQVLNLGNRKIVYAITFIFIVGILVNFFSPEGLKGAMFHFSKQKKFLAILFLPILLNTPKRLHSFLLAAALSLLVSSLYGIYEFHFLHAKRISSIAGLTQYGPALMLAVVFLFSIIMNSAFAKTKFNYLLFVLYFSSAIALLYTGTRGAWLGALVGHILIVLLNFDLRRCLRLSPMIIILTMIAAFTISSRLSNLSMQKDESMQLRYQIWETSSYIIQRFPVFGAGANNRQHQVYFQEYRIKKNWPDYDRRYFNGDPHNIYLSFLTEYGAVGVVFIFALFAFVPYQLFRELRRMPSNLPGSAIVLGTLGAIYAFAVIGFFWNLWNRDFFPIFNLYAMIGTAQAAIVQSSKEENPPSC